MTSAHSESPPAFVTTRWTQVLSARGNSPEARAALGTLCEAYWAPVFRFVRRGGRSEDEARDLTQEFFAQLLSHGGFDAAEPARGRFRSYLLGAVRHFLADQHDRALAAKRGGGEVPVPLDRGTASTTVVQVPDPSASVPVAFFDRHWALTVIDRALKSLQADLASAGKEAYYETLKPWLLGDIESLSQAESGRQLGLTEGAVKVAIHRLRKQFRELVKAEVAQTVEDPALVQEELRYLVEALSQGVEQGG
jgi:RNA polymerase sigma-70 factor (ECF subfamily)